MYIKVGEQVIWESQEEKLLGVTIDKQFKFNSHLRSTCKKAGAKVTALNRLAKIMPFKKKRILMSSFIESQFSHCPLLLMFYSRALNNKIKLDSFSDALWQFAAELTDKIIYLLVGISITVTMFTEQWLAMILGIVAVIIARAFIILLLLPLKRHLARKVLFL